MPDTPDNTPDPFQGFRTFLIYYMHAQLSDKKLVCQEFIEALEKCHADGWTKFFGACNQQKDNLNHCLRTERLTRTERNREQAKVRRAKADQALEDFRAL